MGTIFGFLDVSGVPLGGLWGCPGGLLEASLELSGEAEKPSRVHKGSPKSPQGPPKKEENGTGAPHFGVSGDPQMTKNQEKSDIIINNKLKVRKR